MIDAVIWFFHAFERHGEAVIAAFTIVLAFSTIGLWWATRRQIAIARDTAKAAKEAAKHTRTVERGAYNVALAAGKAGYI